MPGYVVMTKGSIAEMVRHYFLTGDALRRSSRLVIHGGNQFDGLEIGVCAARNDFPG
jgi:hypothetical protein